MADNGGYRVADEYDDAPHMESKRKFDDLPAEESITFTGGPDGEVAPVSYNSVRLPMTDYMEQVLVPPPMTDFEIAMERVLQSRNRLVGAEGMKRPRTDDTDEDHNLPIHSNVPDIDQGYSEQSLGKARQEHQQESHSQHSHQMPSKEYYYPAPSFYSWEPQLCLKIEVPESKVDLVIGKSEDGIKYLRHQSGARIEVAREIDSNPCAPTRQVELAGSLDQINRAEQLIKDVIAPALHSRVAVRDEMESSRKKISAQRKRAKEVNEGNAAGLTEFQDDKTELKKFINCCTCLHIMMAVHMNVPNVETLLSTLRTEESINGRNVRCAGIEHLRLAHFMKTRGFSMEDWDVSLSVKDSKNPIPQEDQDAVAARAETRQSQSNLSNKQIDLFNRLTSKYLV